MLSLSSCSRNIRRDLCSTVAVSLLLAAPSLSMAQTVTMKLLGSYMPLTPNPSPTVFVPEDPVMDMVKFQLSITGVDSTMSVYQTTITLNPTYAEFYSTSGTVYSETPAGTTQFPELVGNSVSGNTLTVSYGAALGGANAMVNGTLALGTFEVEMLAPPFGGTPVSLASVGTATTQSNVIDSSTFNNDLTKVTGATIIAAPGPESWAVFGCSQVGLALLLRKRRSARRRN